MPISVHLCVSVLFFVLVFGCGCGARTELVEDRRDSSPVDSGSLDSALPMRDSALPMRDSAVPIRDSAMVDAGDPLACDGLPLPRAGAVSTFAAPPRVDPTGTLISDSLGILVTGGSPRFGVPALDMLYVDLATERADEFPVLGDPVDIASGRSLAVYLGAAERTVAVVGGRVGGAPSAQSFALSGEMDPTEPRGVAARRLPAHPAGPVQGHVGVYDPVAARLIVHAGAEGVGTWTLDVSGDPTWRELLPPESSPPPGPRAMGYDPRAHRAIEITDDEDGEGALVYALLLEEGTERWERLGPIDFVPSVRGELLWDDRICGFHLLSARRTRCVLEHWILVMTSPPTTIFRGELSLDPPPFDAGALYVAATDELVLYGGEECREPGVPQTVVHRVALTR